MARRPTLLLLALVGACYDGAAFDLEIEGGTHVLLRPSSDDAASLVLRQAPARVALPSDEAWLLSYDFPPEALLLEAHAPLPVAGPRAPNAPLPAPRAVHRFTEAGWVAARPEDLGELPRIPAVTFEGCHARGGCLSLEDPPRCDLACAPAAPASPRWPDRPCPSGWTRTEPASGPHMCAPAVPADAGCPSDQRQAFGASGCAPLRACTGAAWPTPRTTATAVLHVRAGANGDGSAEAPFGTLAAALAVAPPGADLLLAAGEHPGPIRVETPDLRLAGGCPGDVAIVADAVPLTVDAASGQLEGLTLQSRTSTAVVIEAGAALELAGARLVAPGVALRARGAARAEDVRLEAERALLASDGAAAEIVGLQAIGRLEVRGGASLELEDARVASGGVVGHDAARLVVRRATVTGAQVGVGAIGVARIAIEDLTVLDAARDGIRLTTAAAPAQTSSITLTRLGFFEVEGPAMTLLGGGVDARDVYAETGASGGALYISSEPYVPDPPPMSFRGLWFVGAGHDMLVITRPRDVPPQLVTRIEDLVIRTPPDAQAHRFSTAGVARDLRLELSRAYVEGRGKGTLTVACASARLEDVTVVGEGEAGLVLEASIFEDGPTVEARRVRVEGRLERGLYVRGSDSCPRLPSAVYDLDLIGAEGRGAGIVLNDGAAGELHSAQVTGFGVGLSVVEHARPRLRGARIVGNEEGVRAHESIDLTDVLRQVVLDNGWEVVLE